MWTRAELNELAKEASVVSTDPVKETSLSKAPIDIKLLKYFSKNTGRTAKKCTVDMKGGTQEKLR